MSKKLKIVSVAGSLGRPSKAATLADALVDRIQNRFDTEWHRIELAEVAADVGAALSQKDLSPYSRQLILEVERADLLVVASPVYRASYTGLFKHFFDLVHHEGLLGTPVLLAATGGSERHSLIIDHQLRPLFSFFQALTLPVGVYATDADFVNGRLRDDSAIQDRIDLAISGVSALLGYRFREDADTLIS